MKSTLLVIFIFAGVVAFEAQAALIPKESEYLSGHLIQDFHAETVTGKSFKLSDYLGKPLVFNFFTSWCPACQKEISQLKQIEPDLKKQGVILIGVLADTIVTPDTVKQALEHLRLNPLPYPVVMMNESMQKVFSYEGFPSTYFINSDGQFSTSLLGYQQADEIRKVADRITLGTSTEQESKTISSEAPPKRHHSWDSNPLSALWPGEWEDWHPMIIHFPIVLLFLEALFVCAYLYRPRESFEQFSKCLLWLAVISFVPAILTGIHDAGVDLGPGSPFMNGLRDRIANFFRLESSVTLHVLFALPVVILAGVRLLWRLCAKEKVFQGRQRVIFASVMLIGLWLLFAAGQIGGGISHP